MCNRLNRKKNQISDFSDLYFSSYGYFWSFLYPNFFLYPITRKIDISFVSAHFALSVKTGSKLRGGVCISLVGNIPSSLFSCKRPRAVIYLGNVLTISQKLFVYKQKKTFRVQTKKTFRVQTNAKFAFNFCRKFNYTPHAHRNRFKISFLIEWNMIVVTIFLSN